MSAIRIEALEKWFPPTQGGWRAFLQPFATPTFPALRGISLEVNQGEAVALLGGNGAGKSTLLRILATLLLPTKGRATVAGHDVAIAPAAVRAKIGYHSGADQGFYPRLTARENLRFFARLSGRSGEDLEGGIESGLKMFELKDAADRQVRTLSSGTVQRFSLIRALLSHPTVLLLDEPTRSLDPYAAAEFRGLLKNTVLRQQGVCMLFASHTLSEIEELADRVAILHEGKIVACDSPIALADAHRCSRLEDVFLKLTGHFMEPLPDSL